MLEIKCPACGGTMRLEEGRLLRACPYCGAELSREAAARGLVPPGAFGAARLNKLIIGALK